MESIILAYTSKSEHTLSYIYIKNEIQNLKVLKVVADKNLLVIKGCVPGCKNSYVIIQK